MGTINRTKLSLLLTAFAACSQPYKKCAHAFSVDVSRHPTARGVRYNNPGAAVRLCAKPSEDEGGVVEPIGESTIEAGDDNDDDVAMLKKGAFVNGSVVPGKKKSGAKEDALTDDEEPATNDKSPTAVVVEENVEDKTPVETKPPPGPQPDDTLADKNTLFLQSLGAITNRGEFATPQQKEAASSVITALEAIIVEDDDEPNNNNNMLQGTWELVYSNTQLFRASPFFLAGRATCTTPEQAQQYDWFCDMHRKALAMSQIRAVRQIVTPDQLISEFEVEAGSVPFVSTYSGGLPVTITGAIVSTADLTYLTNTQWELFMDTVEIKGSNLPLLRQLLDIPSVQLATRDLSNAIESVVPEYSPPKPALRTTYCTEQYRISRDQDDNVFVYVRTSDATTPTDYSSVDADLGLLGLLEGFNDAVTKLFM